MKNKQLQTIVKTMLDGIERQTKTLENGEIKTWLSFKLDFIMGKSKEYETLTEAMCDLQTDSNTLYSAINDCLDWLEQALEANTDETARLNDFDYVENIDQNCPVYTSDLTGWLNASNYNVYYLTEALQEYSPNDGFNLLTSAWCKCQYEIYNAVIKAINDNYLNN